MKFVKNFLIIIVITVGIIVMLDVATRIYLAVKWKSMDYLLKFDYNKIRPTEYSLPGIINYDSYFKYIPGVFTSEQTSAVYSINSRGFRTAEFTDRKKEGVTRVFCLGGSSTMGIESNDNETYPYYLQEVLNEKSAPKKFEVINVGLSSYCMELICNLFEKEVINYDPDIITICSAFNEANRAKKLQFKNTNLSLRLFNLLYGRWMLYTVLLEKASFSEYNNYRPFLGKRYISSEPYVNNLEAVISLAKEHGIKVVLVKQPMGFEKRMRQYMEIDPYIRKDILDERISLDKETIESLEERMLNTVSIREKRVYAQYLFLKEMERLSLKHDLTLVDPLDEFEGSKDRYFIDEVHLTPQGNRKLAEIIARGF